jgi:pimeloyl-ACP methyl ester carboxylesterase
MTSNNDARTQSQAKGLISRDTARLSRRRMLQGSGAALAALGLLGITGFGNPGSVQANEKEDAMSERHGSAKPNIVLVHGAWADGSSWGAVIERLQKAGYNVTAPQFPLTALADNLARLRQVLAVQPGPTILAGHSYGGQIITALGTDAPNVVGLVYIAAFGLDEGETLGGLLLQGPPTPALAHLRIDAQGFGWLPQDDFVEHFAADVDRDQANVMYAVQQPISLSAFADVMGVPAWRSLPSWYLVAKNDEAIPPDAERLFAQRMGATIVEIASSHVAMVSHPDDVVKLIKDAARAVGATQ